MSDILLSYYDTLHKLNEALLCCKEPEKKRVLNDEISDVLFAIDCMCDRGMYGYRPRRSTLMKRADLYIDVERN